VQLSNNTVVNPTAFEAAQLIKPPASPGVSDCFNPYCWHTRARLTVPPINPKTVRALNSAVNVRRCVAMFVLPVLDFILSLSLLSNLRGSLHLLNGRAATVLAALAPAREPLTVPDEEAPVRVCWRYLNNHQAYLNYPAARQAGLPIGSGEVESGHRSVIQQRLKIAGA
jgi:hypothetical protein